MYVNCMLISHHEHKGMDGYNTLAVYLARRGCHCSVAVLHKYMNADLGLYSVVRPKRLKATYFFSCKKDIPDIHYSIRNALLLFTQIYLLVIVPY